MGGLVSARFPPAWGKEILGYPTGVVGFSRRGMDRVRNYGKRIMEMEESKRVPIPPMRHEGPF